MHLLFDLLYPVSYTLFFASSFLLLSRHMRLVPWLWRWTAVLPWVAGGSDLVENAAIISMVWSYPTPRPLLARLTSVATRLKWGFVFASELLWLAGVIAWLL